MFLNLNCCMEKTAKDDAVQSRASWIELGEKNSKHFLNLEKWHRGKKSVSSLRNKQGVLMQN